MRINLIQLSLLGLTLAACSVPQKAGEQAMAPSDSRGAPASARFVDNSQALLYHTLVAEMASRRGQLDVAYQSYYQAGQISDDPQLPERAARIAVFGKAWEEAVLAAGRWLELDPDNMEVRHILATSYLRLKDEPAAREQLVAIMNTHPDGVEHGAAVAYALLRHDANQQLTQRVATRLAEDFPASPAAHYNLSRLSSDLGMKEAALAALDRALELRPNYPEAVLLQARVRIESGDTVNAFAALREQLDRTPDSVTRQLGYARLLIQSGAHDEAIEAMGRAYELAPDSATVVLNLGLMAPPSRLVKRPRPVPASKPLRTMNN